MKIIIRTIRLCFLISFVIFTLFTCGCGGKTKDKQISSGISPAPDLFGEGLITGHVRHHLTKLPINRAIVQVDEYQALTNLNGEFTLGPLPEGIYKLTVIATDYRAGLRDNIRVYSGKTTENVDFELKPQTTSYSDDFAILSIAPFLGTDGDEITITCNGIGKQQGRVTFSEQDAQIIDWNSGNNDQIKVIVPPNVVTGPVKVYIEEYKSSETDPEIFIAYPTILAVEPTTAKSGDTVLLKGRNFNLIPLSNKIKLGVLPCLVNAVFDHETLQIQLPPDSKTGVFSIRIETDQYQIDGTSNVRITINPELTSLSPRRSVSGVPMYLTGRNFGANRSEVKVHFGSYIINHDDFLEFSDTQISFEIPGSHALEPGKTAQIRVQVNDAISNPLNYIAFNRASSTIEEYGIYNFDDVSNNKTLRLATLKPQEHIAFLTVIATDNEDISGKDYSYTVSAAVGAQTQKSLAPNIKKPSHSAIFSNKTFPTNKLRLSLTEPAEEIINIYLRDFTTLEPWLAINDQIATATLIATGSKTIIYLDENARMTEEEANIVIELFDDLYTRVATALSDGITTPPEGNIDEQSRIALFFSPSLNDTRDGNPIKSYFDPRDKDPSALNSAATEIIYVNSVDFFKDLDAYTCALADSLQQMIYFNQKSQFASFNGTDWQSLGLRIWLRQEYGAGMLQGNSEVVSWISAFLNNPSTTPLAKYTVSEPHAEKGLNYLFTQYLYDRCGSREAIKILNRRNAYSGLKEIHELLVKPHANPSSDGLASFFNDFCIALYCDGLNLATSLNNYNEYRYTFSNIKIREQYGLQGLRGAAFNTTPISNDYFELKGFSCSLIEYKTETWGDLEFTFHSHNAGNNLKTWVIYYSLEK